MKELSIEQKAQRYDEAIKRAKELLEIGVKDTRDKRVVLSFFPELRESEDGNEDERIRQFLIKCFTGTVDCAPNIKGKDVLAWLEKQGGQPKVKYIYTKFQIGDVIVEIKPNGYCQPVRVKYIGEESYYCKSDDEKRFLSFPIISQDEYELVKQVSVWSEEDEKMVYGLVSIVEDWYNNQSEEEKEYYGDCGYVNFLKSLKDRVQPKQEWSEEDETRLTNTIIMLKEGASLHFNKKDITKAVDWLKSLRPQNRWKPNEEQMEALLYEVNAWDENSANGQNLKSLYKQLKKLK